MSAQQAIFSMMWEMGDPRALVCPQTLPKLCLPIVEILLGKNAHVLDQ